MLTHKAKNKVILNLAFKTSLIKYFVFFFFDKIAYIEL